MKTKETESKKEGFFGMNESLLIGKITDPRASLRADLQRSMSTETCDTPKCKPQQAWTRGRMRISDPGLTRN
jgi:hypothetical protein